MYKHTKRLKEILDKYKISELTHGAKEDKLGDAIEDYCISVFEAEGLLTKYKNNCLDLTNSDEFIFYETLKKIPIDKFEIRKILATKNIKHRFTGGNPKTDIIIEFHCYKSKLVQIPISVKSSTASKVAMAEFDVDTIIEEVGIKDPELKSLLEKHQIDASAKNFTPEQKLKLLILLKPYAKQFVRWVISGSPIETEDLRFPILIVKFALTKTDEIKKINVFSIDEYVDSIMLNKKNEPRKGGFGTGLSWTYATGSKGKKIQFKG